jgi:hypothetical protein
MISHADFYAFLAIALIIVLRLEHRFDKIEKELKSLSDKIGEK